MGKKHLKAGILMCGHYYVADDTAKEIEKLVRQVDEKMRRTAAVCVHL